MASLALPGARARSRRSRWRALVEDDNGRTRNSARWMSVGGRRCVPRPPSASMAGARSPTFRPARPC
jgi:hypothetical protein